MTAVKRLVVVSAGLSQPSSTRLLADRLAAATSSALEREGVEARVEVIELREHARDIADNLVSGFASPRLQERLDDIVAADGLIVVSPVFTASVSGLFKSFVDLIEPGSIEGLPVLIGATGGSDRHALVTETSMRPLFVFHHAAPVTTAVYAAAADWGAGDEGDRVGELAGRIGRAGRELADAIRRSERIPGPRDPFALPEGFSPVGAYGETR